MMSAQALEALKVREKASWAAAQPFFIASILVSGLAPLAGALSVRWAGRHQLQVVGCGVLILLAIGLQGFGFWRRARYLKAHPSTGD
jgi:hypothetical protein